MAGGHGGSRANAGRKPKAASPEAPTNLVLLESPPPRVASGLELLQQTYRDLSLPLNVRLAAANSAAIYESPKCNLDYRSARGSVDPDTLSNETLAAIVKGATYEEA